MVCERSHEETKVKTTANAGFLLKVVSPYVATSLTLGGDGLNLCGELHKNGAADGIRIHDLLTTNEVLYQLSYGSVTAGNVHTMHENGSRRQT